MSISKNELRQVRSLAQKKFRDESGRFVVEGEKMVSEALASGFEVVSVYRRDEIGEEAMARLSMLSSPSPVLAVVRQPARRGCSWPWTASATPATWAPSSGWRTGSASTGSSHRPTPWNCTIPRWSRPRWAPSSACRSTGWTSRNSAGRSWPAADTCTGRSWMGKTCIPRPWTISPAVAACVSDRLFIPPYPADDPGSESLNAAIATAITVAEFRRR